MKILFSFFLFALCTAVLSQDSVTPGSSIEPTTETTVEPTTKPTEPTTKPTEPTTKPVEPTTKPTEPTTKPTEPTTKPTEPPTTVAPTTVSPITTTKAPEPQKCEWNVTQGGVTCIRAQLKAKFIVPIEGKDYTILLGCKASDSQSDCSSNETQTLVLSETNYTLTMIFEKESGKVLARNVSLAYNLAAGRGEVANNSETIFKVKAGNSYLCTSETDIHMENVTMEVSDIHIQAFGEKDNENYGSAEDCAADDKVSDIVPIAVGVALGALIIIVLIAYLVGRRRSRQKGYQSV